MLPVRRASFELVLLLRNAIGGGSFSRESSRSGRSRLGDETTDVGVGGITGTCFSTILSTIFSTTFSTITGLISGSGV